MTAAENGQAGQLRCPTGKQVHVTKGQARTHLAHLRHGRRSDKSRTTAFRCGFCGFWHVGRR